MVHDLFILCSLLSGLSKKTMEQALDSEIAVYKSKVFADSTKLSYSVHTRSYLAFCEVMGYCAIPASSATLCRYAAMLARSHKISSIKQYLNIIRILHLEWDLPNPLLNDFHLSSVLKGIKRHIGDNVSRKSPITPGILLQILNQLNLSDVRDCHIWAACLVMFFTMLRRSNMFPASKTKFNPNHQLCRDDFKFTAKGIMVTIRWSKTIQFRDRIHTIPLPRIKDSPLCPSQAVFLAFSKSSDVSESAPAFSWIHNTTHHVLTASAFQTCLSNSLTTLGLQKASFSCHSFRRGGASWAFQNGVPIETIRQIGDWKSNAYMKYIYDSEDSLIKAVNLMSNTLPTFTR